MLERVCALRWLVHVDSQVRSHELQQAYEGMRRIRWVGCVVEVAMAPCHSREPGVVCSVELEGGDRRLQAFA